MTATSTTAHILQIYLEGRLRLENMLPKVQQADLQKRLHPEAASLGWLLQHIAEVEQLFAQRFFGRDISFDPHTLGPVKDDGRPRSLADLSNLLQQSRNLIIETISAMPDNLWGELSKSDLFGPKTYAEAIGRLVSHNGYHSGQASLALKYGQALIP